MPRLRAAAGPPPPVAASSRPPPAPAPRSGAAGSGRDGWAIHSPSHSSRHASPPLARDAGRGVGGGGVRGVRSSSCSSQGAGIGPAGGVPHLQRPGRRQRAGREGARVLRGAAGAGRRGRRELTAASTHTRRRRPRRPGGGGGRGRRWWQAIARASLAAKGRAAPSPSPSPASMQAGLHHPRGAPSSACAFWLKGWRARDCRPALSPFSSSRAAAAVFAAGCWLAGRWCPDWLSWAERECARQRGGAAA